MNIWLLSGVIIHIFRGENMLKVTGVDEVLEAELFWEIRKFLNDRELNGKIVSTKAKLEDEIYNNPL